LIFSFLHDLESQSCSSL